MNPILFVDILKQSSYKTTILLSLMHKQRTYFSKKYSKSNRITLTFNKPNNLSNICKKDNIKAIIYLWWIMKKYNIMITIHFKNMHIDKLCITKYVNLLFKSATFGNIKITRYFLNNGYNVNTVSKINDLCITSSLDLTYGTTLLFCLAAYKNVNVMKLLLDRGANIYFHFGLIILRSAKYGNVGVMKLLLYYNICNYVNMNTVLRECIQNKYEEKVINVLEHFIKNKCL